jgi:uncharacterized protein (DUF58 family)
MNNNNINLLDAVKYKNLELLARQMVEGFITGLHRSPYHGFSVEFAEHKIYNTGESTRHIDWKVFAKSDRLYTKRYEEETNLRCQILLDISSSMYYPAEQKGKITFSIVAAAAICYMLQKQRDAVGIITFDDAITSQTQIKSTASHIHKLFVGLEQLLASTPKQRPTAQAKVLHQVAEAIHRRSLVIIFSDMFDSENEEALFSALKHLKYNNHEVLVFHTYDGNTERDFQFENRPYEFIDLETGEKLKLKPQEVKAAFEQKTNEYYHRLKIKCGSYKIDFIDADINKGLDQILLPYLVKRSKMH